MGVSNKSHKQKPKFLAEKLIVSDIDKREANNILGCIQKFRDWLSGARTANGVALCH
jgi:hypothetical protein